MDKLVTQGWLAYQRQSPAAGQTEEIARGIAATGVDVAAYLAQTTITVREFLGLQVGDIIQTTKPTAGEIILQVEGENKFAGRIGRHNENLAVKITRRAEVEESI